MASYYLGVGLISEVLRKSPLGSIRTTHGHFLTVDWKIARRDVTAAEYNNDRMHGLSNVTIANVWSFGNTANVLRTGFAARGQKADFCPLPSRNASSSSNSPFSFRLRPSKFSL